MLWLLAMLPNAKGASETTISAEPKMNAFDVDESFNINVTVDQAPYNKTWAWEIQMNWTASVLNLTGVTEGAFLSQSGTWDTYFAYDINRTLGHVRVGCTLIENPTEQNQPLPSGNGTLCTLGFDVLDVGNSTLDLYGTLLLDYDLVNYTHSEEDGYFSVKDVAVIDLEVWPKSVPQGQPVYINVTVENQGGSRENFTVYVYADQMGVENHYDIGDEVVTDLPAGASTELDFTWDTIGVPAGSYWIVAEADLPSDVDPSDNSKRDRVGGICVPYVPREVTVFDILALWSPLALLILIVVGIVGGFKILMSSKTLTTILGRGS